MMLPGNLTSYGGWSYGYDADNRVISANGGGHSVSFVYDGLGRCLQRTIDGVSTTFSYDGWKPIAEWDSPTHVSAWNLYGPGPDEILMRYRASDASYLHYHSDQFGNVKFLLNSTNVGVEKYSYDAYGAPTVTNWDGSLPRSESNYGNRFMFNGREYLDEANLYDSRARAYSPELGRFLQPDPIGFAGDPANLYRYCANNSVNLDDPTGLDPTNKTDGSGSDDFGSLPGVSDGTGRYIPTGSHIPLPRGASVYSAGNFPSGFVSTNGWGSISGPMGPITSARGGWPPTGKDPIAMGQVSKGDAGLEPLKPASQSPTPATPSPTTTPTIAPGALGTVTQVYNDVRLLSPNAPSVPATVGMSVFRGQALKTGYNSRAEFTYFNGYLFRMGSYSIFNPGTYPLGPAYTPTPIPAPLVFPGPL